MCYQGGAEKGCQYEPALLAPTVHSYAYAHSILTGMSRAGSDVDAMSLAPLLSRIATLGGSAYAHASSNK